jgi:protein TonB
MTDIQKNDPGYGLAKEAKVLKSLKNKWSPGMIDSKPVRTAYNLPITVQNKLHKSIIVLIMLFFSNNG